MSGTNNYSGGTIVSLGTLIIGTTGTALGSGVVTFSATGTAIDLNGKGLTIASLASSAASAGSITNSSAVIGTLTLNGNITTTSYAGTITDGTGKVAVIVSLSSGTTVTLAGTNTFGQGLTLSSGIVSVNATGNLGTTSGGQVTFSGGTLQLTGTTFNSTAANRTFNVAAGGGTLSVASGVTSTIASPLSGPGTLTITGTGATITFNGASPAFTGVLALSPASGTETLKLGGTAPLGTAIVSFAATGSVLDLAGVNNSIGNLFEQRRLRSGDQQRRSQCHIDGQRQCLQPV